MRLWSLHPSYLDTKGLVALWRETLLAKQVLLGKTKGYTRHPQLLRFKQTANPVAAVDHYLRFIYEEALTRGYNFDKSKIGGGYHKITMQVTKGQLDYELLHLEKKLVQRDISRLQRVRNLPPIPHPMFSVVPGDVESWEITY